MKKIAGVYDPYLDTLGGGERYCLTVVEILLSLGYEVDIFWSGDQELLSKAQSRFELNLEGARFVPDIFRSHPHIIEEVENPEKIITLSSQPHSSLSLFSKITNLLKKYKITKQYDLFFYLSDWSVPFLFSQNNLLHVQVPFVLNQPFKSKIINKFKSLFFNKVICNSKFTSNFAQSYFGSKCMVLYPPVDVTKFDSTVPKENIILSVGRFDNILNSKKQEVLIEAFKKIYKQNPNTDWKLILAGGSISTPDKNSFLQHLNHLAKDLPIKFIVNPVFDELRQLYAKSKIYWHAAGYEIDEKIHPESTEHFGMAPVEAMASGCVPLLVNKGGLPEIFTNNTDGYLWNSLDELISKTQLLIGTPSILSEKSLLAAAKSHTFSKEKFSINLQSLINKK